MEGLNLAISEAAQVYEMTKMEVAARFPQLSAEEQLGLCTHMRTEFLAMPLPVVPLERVAQ